MAFIRITLTILLLILSEANGSGWYERYVKLHTETLPSSPQLHALWTHHIKLQGSRTKRDLPRYPVPPFDCHTRFPGPDKEPSSIHQLHPANVDVVAAMGDSVTAGNGVDARYVFQSVVQYRGLSWSAGGDQTLEEGVLTLPNILKEYNPSLVGYSTGTGNREDSDSGLNVAGPGDTSYDMPGQARLLVERLREMTDFENDWKIITVFVGGNDLCEACQNWERYSAENYGENLRIALDILHKEVPRAFVNVALVFDITPVARLGSSIRCRFFHRLVCPCGDDEDSAEALRNLTRSYQDVTEALVNSGRYDTRDDFTVVVQPFFKQVELPVLETDGNTLDMSYFSADCLHFSGKGQGAAALSLWNNMCEPVGEKQEVWHSNQDFHCPGSVRPNDHHYFQTTRNRNF